MKFNLKNRPVEACLETQVKKDNEWFEGFEKELRELQEKEIPEMRDLTVVYIKEILGE